MKSIEVIKQIIPVLTTIQGAGCFSNSLVATVKSWKKNLVTAACEDKIDLSDAVIALEEMERAPDFENQQDAIATSIAMFHEMLDDIPAGKMPVYVPPSETRQQVARRLSVNIEKTIDTLSVNRNNLDQMLKDASVLTVMVRGAIYDGDISPEEEIAAELTYNAIENFDRFSYKQRCIKLEAANDFAKRMAA